MNNVINVSQLIGKNGAVKNQFILSLVDGVAFQSYQTLIAKKQGGKIILDTQALNYSKTTSKYLYQFLGMNKKEIEADKTIVYMNLN